MNPSIRTLAASACLLASACSLAPPASVPQPPIPLSWPIGDAYLAQSEAALPAVFYTDVFRDPRLQQLISVALSENRDLRIAFADLAAARARVRVVRSGQFPSVGLNTGVTVSRSGSASAGGDENGDGDTRARYAVQGGISAFELDLFGKLANATEAQRDRALATEAASRTVRIALIADVAQAWAAYAADRDLLAIAEATAANARESVRLTELRLRGGMAPRTDLSQAQQVLAGAELAIAEQQAALAQDLNLLRLLVGAEVEPALLPEGVDEIAASFAAAPAGLDSRVLLRRPDVIEAEFLLRAANADIGVARAQLFPSVSLTGLLGLASSSLGNLLTGGAFNLTGGADAAYSIFDAGGRRANVAVSEVQREAAIAVYERAIQTAFRETADALADQGTLRARGKAASDNVAAAATTARLTEARYRNGIDSFLDSLIAQRSLFAARQQQVGIRFAELQNKVTLYRVLGTDGEGSAAAASVPALTP
ncbi:efflux transporter outer membrane subunit [Parafrankia sp. BMG5.11]|uniref:efflux transporter outer membrane subunit n=1 Tax=Parafrankia sp. BMG5.11 TaxID=222540 RepID=UPI00103F8C2B|nr:efflux transporter outer membrane subunit [Parafrankia sp. BMG5.11]TCJ39794.1 efflux transporter outer membrane subunit [Parafrankia sp. BMG5.11]